MRSVVILLTALTQVGTQAAERPASEALTVVRAGGAFKHIRDVTSQDVRAFSTASPIPGSPTVTAAEQSRSPLTCELEARTMSTPTSASKLRSWSSTTC